MKFTGERIIPEDGSYMFQRHMETYGFALNFCKNKTVLDAGCGEGYGSHFLAVTAAAVTGIDISKEAVHHAAGKYVKDNLKYLEMDLQELSLEADSFDVVVSSQVLEHLDNPDKFLAGVKRVLKGNGIAVICTPNKKVCEDEPKGKYHARDYHLDEFRKLLSTYFANVEYYGLHFNTPLDSMKAVLVKAIVKYDIIGLRKLFTRNFRKKVDIAIESTVSLKITKDNVNDSLDLIGVCRR